MKKKNVFLILLFMVTTFIIPSSVGAAGLDLSRYTSENLSDAFTDEAITGVDYGNYTDSGDKVVVYLFRGKGCRNCINFLNYVKDTLIPKYGDKFKVISYKVAESGVSNTNFNLLDKTASFLNGQSSNGTYATPYIVIGDQAFSGAIDSEKKAQIEAIIQSDTRYNVLEEMVKGTTNVEDNKNFTDGGITFTTNKALSSNHTLKVSNINAQNIKLGDFNYIAAYDISMYNGSTIVPLSGGSFRIKIPVSTKYDIYKVAYIKNGTVAEEISATYENGFVSFTTTHLSEYAVYGKNKSNNISTDIENGEKNPDTLDSIQLYGTLFTLSCLMLLGSIIVYNKKKKNKSSM